MLVLTDLPVTTRTRSRTQRQMVQLTLTGEEATEIEVRCECGELCKNQRGLKIHQSKSKCGDVRTQTQRTKVPSDETQEITSQDSTHSTGDLSTSESSHDSSSILNEMPSREKDTTATPCKERVSWPKMSEDRAWKQFDDDVDMVLETTMQGTIERKINTLSTIAYNIGKERFSVEEQRQSKGSPE